jgi:hypothetical protein
MSKVFKKAKRRLVARKASGPSQRTNMYNEPGSMNPNKCHPKGNGRRTKDQIKSHSRNATNR